MTDHQPGQELDRLVAERVMGWEPTAPLGYYWKPKGTKLALSDRKWTTHAYFWSPYCFRPSTNIAHAWEVVERVRSLGWTVWVGPCADNGPGWDVQIKRRTNLHERFTADTAPLVICRAALAVVR